MRDVLHLNVYFIFIFICSEIENHLFVLRIATSGQCQDNHAPDHRTPKMVNPGLQKKKNTNTERKAKMRMGDPIHFATISYSKYNHWTTLL